MSDDKIEEIRKRSAFANENKSVISPTGFSWTIPGWQAHNDRAALLAEVDRLRADNERLRAALSSVRIDGPDFEGLVWVSFVSQGLAARAHVVVGDENRMASRVALRFKELRRAALEGKP